MIKHGLLAGFLVVSSMALRAQTPADSPATGAAAKDAAVAPVPTEGAAWDKIVADFKALRAAEKIDPDQKKKMIVALYGETKDFATKYPADAHANDATMLQVQLGGVMSANHLDGAPSAAELAQIYDRLATDPKVSKAQHATIRAMQIKNALETAAATPNDDAQWDAIEGRFDSFGKEFGADFSLDGQNAVLPMLRNMELSVLATSPDQARYSAVIKKLAASPDPNIAALAQHAQADQQRTADLKTKPLDLKFTAVDGQAIDLAKMRGKVVLVDFWATWCGPCVGEVPNVVAAYQKLHGQGFEIVGVSLDQDKDAMLGFTKEHRMTWPQYFDGKGWDNAISKGFGIDSIPAMWLVDKKGMLATMDGREDLAGQVEKLLAAP